MYKSLLGSKIKCQTTRQRMEIYTRRMDWLVGRKTRSQLVRKTGTRNGSSYVMGRIGDTGPYSPENTKCITNSENGYDRRINGVAARGEQKSNLTEKQVREIYFSTDSLKVLSQRYPVGMGGIQCIKRGSSWKHLTKELEPAHRNKRGAPTKVKIIKPRKNRKIGIPFSEK